jgi:hypothetical protein
MIKLICISETEKKTGIFLWFLKKISKPEIHPEVKGEEVEKIIDREYTDFLYVNIKRPANTDVMDMLCFRNINRLRVSIFMLDPFKFRIIKFFFPSEMVKSLSHQ